MLDPLEPTEPTKPVEEQDDKFTLIPVQQGVQPTVIPSDKQRYARGVRGNQRRVFLNAVEDHLKSGKSYESFQAEMGKTMFETEGWAGTVGVAKWIDENIRFQPKRDRDRVHFWTDELYDELITPLSRERQLTVLDADNEDHARKIVADYAQLDRHKQAWTAGATGSQRAALIGLSMLDPIFWVAGGPVGKITQASMGFFKSTSKLAQASLNAGILGTVEATTAYALGSMAESGNPMLRDDTAAEWALWGGAFGAGIGGLGGLIRASKNAGRLNAIKGVRYRHSEMVLQKFGGKAHQFFTNLSAATPEKRGEILEQMAALKQLAAEGQIPRDLGDIRAIGPRMELEGIINELSVEDFMRFIDAVNTDLALQQAEQLAKYALKKAQEDDILSLTRRDLSELSKNPDINKDNLDALLSAQAKLLKETNRVGSAAINRVLAGEALLLDTQEIKWLAKNRPEVFGKDGIDVEELLKGRRLDAKKLRDSIAENTKRLEAEREALSRKEFASGDIVMTADGKIGRIAEIGEGGQVKIESLEVSETRKLVSERKKEIKKLEAALEEGTGTKAHLANTRRALAEAENSLKNLLDDLDVIAKDELFEAPAVISARFLVGEEIGLSRKPKWNALKETDRYKTKGKRAGPPKRMSGTIFGERVLLTATLTAGKGLPKLPHDQRIWTLTFGGEKGKDFVVHSEGWWNKKIADGEIKVTDAEYKSRIVLQDGGSQKSIKAQVEDIVRREVLANYEKKIIAKNKARNLRLSRPDDPKNILDELAEGRIPIEIKEALGDVFSEDAVKKWARQERKRSATDLDKLRHGEEVEGVKPVQSMEIGDTTAPELGPLEAYLSGKLFGLGSHATWGLTHEVGAIRRIFSLTYGSWMSLTDPITGAAVAAGGAADSIFAGGAMNFRRMEVKSRMAKYVEVMLEEVENFKRASDYRFWQVGQAEADFQKMVKRYIEDPDYKFEGVPKGMEDGVRRAGDQFRESIADILEWAKKNGVDELKNVSPDKFYFPRYRNHAMMERIINLHKQPELDDMLKRALMSANTDMSEDAAELIARRLRRYYMEPSGGRPLNDSILGLKNQDLGEFMDQLDEAFAKVEGVGKLTKKQREILKEGWGAGVTTSTHARYRIQLDMGTLSNKKIDGRQVPVSELFETNTTATLERYMIDLVSPAQEHTLVKMFASEGYEPKNLDELLEHIKSQLGDMGIVAGSVTEQFNLLTQFMRNEPRFKRGRLNAGASILKQWATILKLPGFVPAQVPEAITAWFSTGFWPKLVRRMPIINQLIDDAKLGRISKENAAKFVHFDLGMGNIEHDLALLYSHHEMLEEGSTLVGGKYAGKIYGYQSQLLPRISKISGFRQLNVYSDLVAHRNFCDLLVEASRTGKRDLFTPKRLASYGVSADDFDEILDALKKDGVVTTESIKGTNVYSLNTDRMSQSVAAKFRTMAAANIRQVVQRSLSWDMPMGLAQSEWGEFLTQFRTFSMSSMSNHFARNLTSFDKFAFSHVSSMFIGGLATQYGLNMMHFHDDQRRLEEAMTPENLVRGALIRAGFMGMIPDLVDAPFAFLRQPTIFSPSNKAMLLSIPVFDMVRDYSNATETAFKQLTGQRTNGAENYIYKKVIPMTNLMYWRILVDTMLPDDVPVISKL